MESTKRRDFQEPDTIQQPARSAKLYTCFPPSIQSTTMMLKNIVAIFFWLAFAASVNAVVDVETQALDEQVDVEQDERQLYLKNRRYLNNGKGRGKGKGNNGNNGNNGNHGNGNNGNGKGKGN